MNPYQLVHDALFTADIQPGGNMRLLRDTLLAAARDYKRGYNGPADRQLMARWVIDRLLEQMHHPALEPFRSFVETELNQIAWSSK